VGWRDYARQPSRIPAKLVRMVQNAVLDWRYGIRASGAVRSPFEAQGAYLTLSTQVSALDQPFDPSRCPIHANDVLVDVGCGPGRVIAYWLSRGFTNEIIGVEINPVIAAETARRLQSHPNVRIVTGDVVDDLPARGTVFFLFSPFDLRVMRRFRDALFERTVAADRMRIVYYNPSEIAAFQEDPRWDIQRFPKVPGLLFDAAYIRLKPIAVPTAAAPASRVRSHETPE
jgi:hypothetical protein